MQDCNSKGLVFFGKFGEWHIHNFLLFLGGGVTGSICCVAVLLASRITCAKQSSEVIVLLSARVPPPNGCTP